MVERYGGGWPQAAESPLIFACLILKCNSFSGGGGACGYRNRPMSQNAHLTLEGNKEEGLKPKSLRMELRLRRSGSTCSG